MNLLQTKTVAEFEAQVSIALAQAAQLAREDAIKTNTGIIVSRDGKVVEISAEELKKQKMNVSC